MNRAKRTVEGLADRLGKRVDPLIKPMVVGLLRQGILTESSCEGHQNRGMRFPWVGVPRTHRREVERLLAKPGARFWAVQLYGVDDMRGWLMIRPRETNQNLRRMQKEATRFGLLLQRR